MVEKSENVDIWINLFKKKLPLKIAEKKLKCICCTKVVVAFEKNSKPNHEMKIDSLKTLDIEVLQHFSVATTIKLRQTHFQCTQFCLCVG